MGKLVMVETLSQYRMRYVVEVRDVEDAIEIATANSGNFEFEEFSQKHLGTTVISYREINSDEYMRMFNEDNDYLSSWTDEQKKRFINRVEYNEPEEIDDGA
jgi:hypothetical protein